MKRFLKKEWDETEIAPEILWRTRNRAWQMLQKRQRQRRLSLAAAGALAGLAALLILWIRTPSEVPPIPRLETASTGPQRSARPEQAVAELPGTAPRPERSIEGGIDGASIAHHSEAPKPAALNDPEQALRPASQQEALHSESSDPTGQKLNRLVINFRLPKSGVRMIWIKQRTSAPPSGGTG
ncbi:MAG: hypothetical protein V3T83_19340 [Acidobacteriota bacterium]